MRTRQIFPFLAGGESNLHKRLELLYHNGYLDQKEEGTKKNKEYIHAIGNKGATHLVETGFLAERGGNWTEKNRRYRELKHALLISEIMSAFQQSCKMYVDINITTIRRVVVSTDAEEEQQLRAFEEEKQANKKDYDFLVVEWETPAQEGIEKKPIAGKLTIAAFNKDEEFKEEAIDYRPWPTKVREITEILADKQTLLQFLSARLCRPYVLLLDQHYLFNAHIPEKTMQTANIKNGQPRWEAPGIEDHTYADQIFGVQFLNLPPDESTHYFVLEADRKTEPGQRREKRIEGRRQSDFFKKLNTYYYAWKNKVHREQFNLHNFRVLTVTISQARVEKLIEINKVFNGGSGLFWFLSIDEEKGMRDLNSFETLWQKGNGEHAPLFRL